MVMPLLSNISKKAKIGKNVFVGDFTTIHDNVEIGDNTVIESNCIIGYPARAAKEKLLIIGPNSHIRSHSIIYEGSKFGCNFITGHKVFARENCLAGNYFQLGTSTVLDGRATFGHCVRIHSYCIISEDTIVGDFVYFLPRVQMVTDPFPPSEILLGITIKDLTVIAAGALLYPGITLGMGSFIAAASHVKQNVADIHCVAGSPAKTFATLDKYVLPTYGAFHPWIKRIIDKYPENLHPLIEEKIRKIDEIIQEKKKMKK